MTDWSYTHEPDDPPPPFYVRFWADRSLSAAEIDAFDDAFFQQHLHWAEYQLTASGYGVATFPGPDHDHDERAEVLAWLRAHPLIARVVIVDASPPPDVVSADA